MLQRFFNYINKEVWQIHVEKLPRFKAYWIRFLRLGLITSHGFTKSQIQLGASSLTYYTLLAIVPMFALMLGIARAFLFEERLHRWLVSLFEEQEEVITRLINFADASIQNAQGVIAGVGVVILLWAGIKILMNIEAVMNTIWEVKTSRSWARRFSDYLAMIFVFPIFILLASGFTGYLSAAMKALGESKGFLEEISPYIIFLLNFLPLIVTWLLLTFIYIFMPNTEVRLRSAFWAGVITGTIYFIAQWIYLKFQIGVTTYSAIYGAFAAIPLFLIWIHLSWVIILLGAKIAFAIQNVDGYEFISEDIKLSNRFRMILSLRISHLCIKNFSMDEPAPSINEISNTLSIPHSLTGRLVYGLVDSGVLSEIKSDYEKDKVFQPAKNPELLTIKRVLDMINARGGEIPLPSSPELTAILKSLETFSDLIEHSNANIPLKNI